MELTFHELPLRVTIRSSHRRCSVKKKCACDFIKKDTLAQVFSCEFCEISKNAFFKEHLWATSIQCSSDYYSL